MSYFKIYEKCIYNVVPHSKQYQWVSTFKGSHIQNVYEII